MSSKPRRRHHNAVKIQKRTPFTWERRLAFRELLIEYLETGEWPNHTQGLTLEEKRDRAWR